MAGGGERHAVTQADDRHGAAAGIGNSEIAHRVSDGGRPCAGDVDRAAGKQAGKGVQPRAAIDNRETACRADNGIAAAEGGDGFASQ